MESTCPQCGMESAYFDGVSYVCPDCDYSWGEIDEDNNELDEDEL